MASCLVTYQIPSTCGTYHAITQQSHNSQASLYSSSSQLKRNTLPQKNMIKLPPHIKLKPTPHIIPTTSNPSKLFPTNLHNYKPKPPILHLHSLPQMSPTVEPLTTTTPTLVGFTNFTRHNPYSDRFSLKHFHHIEFYSSDSTNVSRRFSWGLGMPIVAKSDLSTGNSVHSSYLLRSGELNFVFTSSYSPSLAQPASATIPSFDSITFNRFIASHGLGVRAVAVEVGDADAAFSISVANGARPATKPVCLHDGAVTLSEVQLYGDVVLRYISFNNDNDKESLVFLPGFETMDEKSSFRGLDFGLRRLDHAVGNVHELGLAVEYIKKFTGFHEFAEFTAEDVGTSESGLNSVVLANNDETVLLPINEPVYGTKRKSQIQTYLEHNEGAGLQHLALVSEDIFTSLREMRKRSGIGGFEFMPAPPPTYYRNLKSRAGDVLSDEQIKECEELGILVDRDDQGTLLQIFTKPIGDRPTMFLEIIQRVGCMMKDDEGKLYQKGGCGGFGKGNFSELFKSIEEYEKTLERKSFADTAAA